jgi:gliding motility-associated-like protein
MKFHRLLFFILVLSGIFLLIPDKSSAQFISDNGLFEVDYIRGCPGTTIQITNLYTATCDCTAACPCDFDYNGDGLYDLIASRYSPTYDTAGVFELEILFSGTSDFITVTIEDIPEPEFEVFSCAAETVLVELSDTNYEFYEVDFGDGTIINVNQGDPVPSHSYADPSPRIITVHGLNTGSSNNCTPAIKNITPLPILPAPSINALIPVDASSLSLDITTQDNILYELQMSENNGPFNVLRTLTAASSSETIDGLSLNSSFYCFQLLAIDPCGGAPGVSNTICSIDLDVTEGNGTAELSWETGIYSGDIEIFRNNTFYTTLPNGTTSFSDTDIICGTPYCYDVRVVFSGGTSRSLEKCITGNSVSGPPPISNVSTQVDDNGNVLVQWAIDTPTVQLTAYSGFEIYRRGPQNIPELISTITELNFLDTDIHVPGSTLFCYEIVPFDNCENRTPDNIEACALQLEGIIDPFDVVTLSWNDYTGYDNGVAYYTVQKSYGGILTDLTQTSDTTFTETDTNTDSQIVIYKIQAIPNEPGITPSTSQTIILYKSNNLYFPEAFTPDDDGLNDVFEVNARFVTTYEIMIFSRWGELIYQSNDITNAWDGKFKGNPVQEGTFICKIRLTDESGQETQKEASIVLVRR